MTAIDALGYAVPLLGAGGLGAVAQKWIAARTKDRAGERRERVELEKIELQREDTGVHATERAFASIQQILREEREEHRREREDCSRRLTKLETDLESYRLENDALKERLAHAEAEVESLKSQLEDTRAQWLRDYSAGEGDLKTTAIGRKGR